MPDSPTPSPRAAPADPPSQGPRVPYCILDLWEHDFRSGVCRPVRLVIDVGATVVVALQVYEDRRWEDGWAEAVADVTRSLEGCGVFADLAAFEATGLLPAPPDGAGRRVRLESLHQTAPVWARVQFAAEARRREWEARWARPRIDLARGAG